MVKVIVLDIWVWSYGESWSFSYLSVILCESGDAEDQSPQNVTGDTVEEDNWKLQWQVEQ